MLAGRVVVVLVAAIALAACEGSSLTRDGAAPAGDADRRAEIVDVGTAPEDAQVLAPVTAVGGSLLAIGGPADGSMLGGILRSAGPGQTWVWVPLPDAPIRTSDAPSPVQWSIASEGSLAVASAVRAEPAGTTLWVWTSADGTTWSGGPVGTYDRYVRSAELVDGDVLAVAPRGRDVVVTLLVDGSGWVELPVQGIDLAPAESANLAGRPWSVAGGVRALLGYAGQTDRLDNTLIGAPSPAGPWSVVEASCRQEPQVPRGACRPTVQATGLLARGLEVSDDDGASWDRAELRLAADPHAVVDGFASLTALPDRGFVGTISGYIPAGGGSLAWVVRSDDGRAWSTVLGPGVGGCSPSPVDTDQPWASAERPVVVGDAVVVAFNCPGSDPGVFRIDADGVAEAVWQERGDHRIGQPFEHNGAVVAAVEAAADQRVRSFVVATPGG